VPFPTRRPALCARVQFSAVCRVRVSTAASCWCVVLVHRVGASWGRATLAPNLQKYATTLNNTPKKKASRAFPQVKASRALPAKVSRVCRFRIQEQGVCGSCVCASAGNARAGANASAYTSGSGGRRGLGILEDSRQPRARLAVSRIMSHVRPSQHMYVDKPTGRENVAGLPCWSVWLQELPV
jgi:hypothetical protein